MLNEPAATTTLFMATERGGFAWMEIGLILTTRFSDAASTVLRYGFKSICVDDMGAAQFPSLERVERAICVDGSTFWIEAHAPGTGESDRTRPVPISEVRKAAFTRLQSQCVMYFLDGSEQVFKEYVSSMTVPERECLFGIKVSDQLAQDHSLRFMETMHG